MTCKTPNCGRAVPHTGHGYCSECFPTVLRDGQPQVIARQPEWLRRLYTTGLPAKDMTRSAS